jgi:hypothetical protein
MTKKFKVVGTIGDNTPVMGSTYGEMKKTLGAGFQEQFQLQGKEMSTVREHLGLLWISRRALMTSNPQYNEAWAAQAALFVGVHLDELISLAGGADVEGWVRELGAEIPADFPAAPVSDQVVEEPCIDTPEFRKLVGRYGTSGSPYDLDALVAHINANLAQARADGIREGREYQRKVDEKITERLRESILKFGIEVEKLLCKELGREWSPAGISIESLIAEFSAKLKEKK